MWKAPNRPKHQISQSYNDGIVNIFRAADRAQPGYQPVAELTPKISLRYEERRVGIQRDYLARQNMIRIERVIRVQNTGNINNQDVAITEDGRRYRIDLVQTADGIFPPSVDLSLVRIDERGLEGSRELV